MWWVTSLVANVLIAWLETLNRTTPLTLNWKVLGRFLAIVLGAQACLWYTWNTAPKMMTAWAVFTVGNTCMRLLVTTRLVGELPSAGVLLGTALILLGAGVIRWHS